MKILQVIDMGYLAGGAEKSVELIKNELIRRGHEVKIMATDKGLAGNQSYADYLVGSIGGNFIQKLIRHSWHQRAYRQVKAIMSDFKPDIVHLHVIGEYSPALLWALGKTPSVLTVHGPEEYTLKLLPWQLPGNDYRRGSFQRKDLKLVGCLRYAHYRLIQRPLFLLGFRRTLRYVLAPSKYIQAAVRGDFPHVDVLQVYNGIVLPEATPLPKKRSLLFVGRLTSVKGVKYLVEGFKMIDDEFSDVSLTIVGDGDERAKLQAAVNEWGLSTRVRFAGWQPADKTLESYRAASIVVIPSIWPENLPTVCIEAMAIGRPVVGTNTGGIPELIDDGSTGLIVPEYDSDAIAAALKRLLSDEKLLAAQSQAAAKASKKFSVVTFADNLVSIYQKALK